MHPSLTATLALCTPRRLFVRVLADAAGIAQPSCQLSCGPLRRARRTWAAPVESPTSPACRLCKRQLHPSSRRLPKRCVAGGGTASSVCCLVCAARVSPHDVPTFMPPPPPPPLSFISLLSHQFPKRRVALVTFSSDVTIIGDGSGEPKTLAGTRLNDFNQMLEAGREVHLTSTIKETAASLTSKVYGLSEGGATALGPAVVAAVGVASNAPGSRVIVCTDGLANVGMGALDEVKTDEERAAVDAFYKRVGTYAVDKGVAVDVIGCVACVFLLRLTPALHVRFGYGHGCLTCAGD